MSASVTSALHESRHTRTRKVVTGHRTRSRLVVLGMVLMGCLLWTTSADAAARDVKSYNWLGYAVRGPQMDAIVLEFSVPTVTCTRDDQALSVWAGFGGLREPSLVQAGVQVRCSGTNPRYQLFQQFTNGAGASTEGPTVVPGDYVRVVVCPAPSTSTRGACQGGAANGTDYMTSVAYKSGGKGEYQLWTDSLRPLPWVNTRTEAECVAERPRDAATFELLEAPEFTAPAMKCLPYRSVSPLSRVDIARGGGGYTAYRLRLIPGDPGEGAVARAPVTSALPGRLLPSTDRGPSVVTATGGDGPSDVAQAPAAATPTVDRPLGSSPLLIAP